MEKALEGYIEDAGIENIAGTIKRGGIAVLPTDTIYGLHCLSTDTDAVERIISIKGRKNTPGFVLLASDMRMIESVTEMPDRELAARLRSVWPAPLTAILPASGKVNRHVSVNGTVAVRIPRHRQLREIIKIVGEPIISTSVNRTGTAPLNRISKIKSMFGGLDAYISRRGRTSAFSSTLADFTVIPPRLLRLGAYPWKTG